VAAARSIVVPPVSEWETSILFQERFGCSSKKNMSLPMKKFMVLPFHVVGRPRSHNVPWVVTKIKNEISVGLTLNLACFNSILIAQTNVKQPKENHDTIIHHNHYHHHYHHYHHHHHRTSSPAILLCAVRTMERIITTKRITTNQLTIMCKTMGSSNQSIVRKVSSSCFTTRAASRTILIIPGIDA
jgi:hypothetical protein